MVEAEQLAEETFVAFGFFAALAAILWWTRRGQAWMGLALVAASFLLQGVQQMAAPLEGRVVPVGGVLLVVTAMVTMGAGIAILAVEGARLLARTRRRGAPLLRAEANPIADAPHRGALDPQGGARRGRDEPVRHAARVSP